MGIDALGHQEFMRVLFGDGRQLWCVHVELITEFHRNLRDSGTAPSTVIMHSWNGSPLEGLNPQTWIPSG